MKKVLAAAFVVLVLCVLDASARMQAASVRVGPEVEEKSSAHASAPNDDKKPARRTEPKKEPGQSAGAPVSPERKSGSEEAAPPANLSSAATPANGANSSSTSDAPPKNIASPIAAPVGSGPSISGDAANEPAANNDATKNTPPVTTPAPSPAASSGATTSTPAPLTAKPSTTTTAPSASGPTAVLTSVYRIGVGDVLDIRLLNQTSSRESTLYTVMAGGLLEYPLVGEPLTVGGMTTEELAAQLIAELRRRAVFERPQVRVSVRDYASHTVLVSGLVDNPGAKVLRREAVPLYVVIAEAQPKPDAARASLISRATGQSSTIDLNDAAAMNMLVQSGDVVNLLPRPREFFYIGGEIGAPGQKDFHAGMTLTQAILASGGVTRPDVFKVRVSRQGADGRLVSTEYNLKEIEGGKVPDPAVQPGDRIEVARARK